MTTPATIGVLNEAQAWKLARAAEVGRIAVVVDGQPEIFPVNYVVDRGTVLIQTSAGTKLAGCVDQPVAFEIDGYDTATGDAWSVVIKGVGRELTNLHEVLDAMQLPLHRWHPAPKPRLIRIEPTAVSGRRFSRAATTATGVVHHVAPE